MKAKHEIKLLEIRKLIDILNSWGDVLVNGNITASERLQIVCNEITNDGYSLDDIENELIKI